MRKFLLLAMCALVSGLALGQIAHNEITSSSGLHIVSMATASDFDNNYDSFVVGTTLDRKVFIGQLDNNSPINLYSTSFRTFLLPDTDFNYFFNGAFVDMDANIVAYGYCGNSTTGKKGIIVKYNMNGTTATSIDYSISSVTNSVVEDGCWGKLNNGSKTYAFIVDNNLMRIPYTIIGAGPANPNVVKNFPYAWGAMSVSWDSFNAKYVVSGTETTNCFIGALPNSLTINNTPYFNVYSMPSNIISSEHTGGHILSGNSQYSDGVAYLVQDFRDSNTGTDGVWVLKVDYMNNTVIGDMGYKFDTAKVSVFDIAHNFDHLFILGNHVGKYQNSQQNFCKRYLMQINLFDSTDVLTYHLNTISNVVPYRNVTNSFLNTIIYNQSTYFVQAAGTYNGNGYITEAYMLEDETCDSLINNYLFPINYTASRSRLMGNGSLSSIWGIMDTTNISTYATESFAMDEDCYSELDRDFESMIEDTKARLAGKIEVVEKNASTLPDYEIDVQENNSFVCTKFNGTCQYIVYDIHGRVVCEGITQNGNTNYLNGLTPGLYLVRVTDSNNGTATRKIVIN